jgi:hypothetical protein
MMGTTCYACDDCKAEKLAGFRPDIFENYESGEPIDETDITR